MFLEFPENAVSKGLSNPIEAFRYIKRECIYSLPCRIDLALRTHNIPKQQDKLAQLRNTPNFCLIVLDACRYDILNNIFDEYFIGELNPTKTVATSTFEYLQYNWPESYDYPYVTAATPVTSEEFNFDETDDRDGLPQSYETLQKYYRGYIPANHFNDLEEVWREAWDEELRVCPPEPVTEKAISKADGTSKLVAHYFQPHGPYVGAERPSIEREQSNYNDQNVKIDEDVWSEVRNGNISTGNLKRYYISNLNRALAAVANLIQETAFDKYVIIGDHGEALGEYGRYGHWKEHPYITVVPWGVIDSVKQDAPQMWKYNKNESIKTGNATTEERLRDLGYLE